MSWLLFFVYTAIFFFLVRRLKFFQLEGLKRWMPAAFFLLKVLAGVALWAVYTFYYTDRGNSDIWKYFDDSAVMHGAAHDHPADFARILTGIDDDDARLDTMYYRKMDHWYQQFDNNLVNDAHIIIRFNAAVRFFSLGNYHVHALFMCFLSFIGLCAVYKTLFPAVKKWRYETAAILFLLPSLLFWGSGVLKEGLMLLSLGVLVYHAFLFFSDKKLWRLPVVFLFGWLLFITKFYVLAALIPALLAAWLVMKYPRFAALKFLLVLAVFTGFGLSMKVIKPVYDPLRILAWKQNDFLKLARGGTYLLSDTVVAFVENGRHEDLVKVTDSTYSIREGADYMFWYFNPDFSDTLFVKGSRDEARYKILTDLPRAGSLMKSEFLRPTAASFLQASPQAMFRALFRPFPWEGRSLLLLLPALENVLLPVLLVLLFFAYRKTDFPALAGFCLTYSLLLLWVMGITTPVLGALVRYRIAALPFLLIGLLMLIDREKAARKSGKRRPE